MEQNPHGAAQGPFILILLTLGGVEISSFFDVALGRQKINKNRALGAEWPSKTLRRATG